MREGSALGFSFSGKEHFLLQQYDHCGRTEEAPHGPGTSALKSNATQYSTLGIVFVNLASSCAMNLDEGQLARRGKLSHAPTYHLPFDVHSFLGGAQLSCTSLPLAK